MSGFTDSERRGARILAVLLALGTLRDLWVAHHPREARLPPPAIACDPPPSESLTARAPVAESAAGAGLDLNAASAAELDRLPGIGPVLASRIVEYRAKHGPFRSVSELRAVPGIGEKLFARLRPSLRAPPE